MSYATNSTFATTSTSIVTPQTAAIGSSENVMGVVSVGASGSQLETGLVQIGIVTGREYYANVFGHKLCPPRFVDNDEGVLERCTLAKNGNHKHELRTIRSYQSADNPIPFGAVRLLKSSVYVEPLEPLPQGYCAIEQTKLAFFERNDPQCSTHFDAEDQTQEICSVEAGVHIHTKKKQIFVPQSKSVISEKVLSFYQDYTYQPSEIGPFVSGALFDSAARSNRPEYAHKLVVSRLSEKGYCFTGWQIPHGWDILSNSVKEKYLDDIVSCYKKGISARALGAYHSVSARGITGLLLLRLSREELDEQKILNRKNKPLALADVCKTEKRLGELLQGRKRKCPSSMQQERAEALSTKKIAVPPAMFASTETAASSSELAFSAALPVQDANVPPKKRLSFRTF